MREHSSTETASRFHQPILFYCLLFFLNPTLQAVGLQQGSNEHLNHKRSKSCSSCFFCLFFLTGMTNNRCTDLPRVCSLLLPPVQAFTHAQTSKVKEKVSFVCVVFWISNRAGGAVYPCTDAQQNQTLFGDLRRCLSSQGVVVVVPRRPGDRLFCCVIELSPVRPLCLLYYISKSHQPTCAAMTAHP